MRIKELPYLVYDSIISILKDSLHVFTALKNPKTWSFILYATLFLMAYYRKLNKINSFIILTLILIVYISRRRFDPEYTETVKRRAFLKNDKDKISRYYEQYKRQCFFTKTKPLPLEEYKKEEWRKLSQPTGH
jgi:hypothetical protein